MDDRAAITALIHEYAERLDAGDLDGVADLFEHASWGSPGRGEPVRGAAAVRRGYDGVIIHENGTPETKHVISNVTVDVDEAGGTASARSYFTVLQARPDLPLQAIIAGRYHDRFERDEGGRWRFADRVIIPDLVGDLSRHLRDPGEAQRA
ncbi:MAG: nuclear transport factor 2 family protein [Acidimicrobiia bacterium]